MTDPQSSPRSARWWPWILVLLLAAGGGYVLYPRLFAGSGKAAEKPAAPTAGGGRTASVVAVAARTADMAVNLNGLGTVTALNTVTVRSRVDGQLLRVAFTEGQLVRQGDLLAELDARPFQVQLTQAEGQLAKDSAALKNAQADLQRYQDLFARGLVTRQQLDTQAATISQVEGSIKTDQGQIDSAKLNLTYARITAPIAGRIGFRLVDSGNMVRASDQNGLVVITQIDPIGVLFTLPEDALPQVLARMRTGARLPVVAWDRDLKKALATGTLQTVDNLIDASTGTVKMKAVFANRDSALFPNQFVNARLLVDTIDGATIIPSAALQRSAQTTFVYVVQKDSTVQTKNVEVRQSEGEEVAVSGLTAGEQVVTEGVDRLQQGAKVAVRKPETGEGGKGGASRRGGGGKTAAKP